jgi:hypothetical protein
MLIEYFPTIKRIKYEGADSKNLLAFKQYNPSTKIMGKTMAERLRFRFAFGTRSRYLQRKRSLRQPLKSLRIINTTIRKLNCECRYI